MPIRVQVVGHGIVEFPDGTDEATMKRALSTLKPAAAPSAPPAEPKPRTWTDTAVDALPSIGGAVGGIVGGIGGTVAGLGVGGVPGAIGGAAVGGGAGEAARQLVNRARGVEAPATMQQAATDIGVQGGIQGGMEAIGGGIAQGAKSLGTAVYRGYLKPSLAGNSIAKAREIVETGIREWLPVTKGGEAKAARIVGQLNAQVSKALKASGASVDLHTIAEQVRSFARRTYQRAGAPTSDFEAAMKVADEIDMHPSLGLPAGVRPTRVDVPVAEADQVKKALDKAIGDTGFGVERTAGTEARKVGRHAAREAIEAKVPGVGKLNARESKAIDALEALTKAAGREENKNPITGWSSLATLGAGGGALYGATQDPYVAAFSALAARGAITPRIATNGAILAAKFGNSSIGRIAPAAALRMGLVMALRQEGQNSESSK